MSSLEDLLPEMAGVFAAQESALENCVAVLTTQLHNLGLDHSRQTRRVVTLETSQRKLQESVATLQETIAGLQEMNARLQSQHEQLQQQQQAQILDLEAIRNHTPTVDLTGLQKSMAEEMQTHTTQLVETMVTTHIAAFETKVSTQIDERLLDSSHRAFLRMQESEETMKTQLEMMEKRFEYLSKIKMEIKEIGKRMERQDQTLDDMRTGLSLLAKSVGTDEIDDEEDNDQEQKDSESRRTSRMELETVVELATPLVLPTFEEVEEVSTIATPEVEHALTEQTPSVVEASVELPIEQPIDQKPQEADFQMEPTPSPLPTPPSQASPQPEDTTQQVEVVETEPEIVREVAVSPQPESEAPPPATLDPASEPPPDLTPPQIEDPPVAEQMVPPPTPPPSPPPTEEAQALSSDQNTASPIAEVLPIAAEISEELVEVEETAPGEDDTFNASATVPIASFSMSHRPSTAQLHHMPTAPSLSTVAYIRSRRQERTAKRGSRRESTMEPSSNPSSGRLRTPLSREEIKVLWNKVFVKIIQLRRLQAINGTSAERTLFRKQHISMGARVKRLEETSSDLEDTMEMLEASIHGNTQTLQALHMAVAQSSSTLDKKTQKLDEAQKLQAQAILGLQEKFEALEAEFRRVRNVSRKESVQNSTMTQQLALLSVELMEVANKLKSHGASLDTHDATLTQLIQKDLPNLTQSVQQAMVELRTETDFKTRELAKELTKSTERLSATQASDHAKLELQLADSVDALYRDFLVLTSALLVAVELAARQNASIGSKPPNSPTKKNKQKTPLDVSAGLLQSVIATFEGDCKKSLKQNQAEEDEGAVAIAAMLFEKLEAFRVDVGKLTQQAEKAVAITTDADTNNRGTSKTKAFEDHLVLLCTNQLRILEEILVSQSRRSGNDDQAPSSVVVAVMAHVKDLVIQLRAVLFLLVLHAQLVEPPQHIHALALAQTQTEATLSEHAFTLSQLATVEAVVKLMNTRLDGFLDMSLEFAKDADVKKSIQELLNTSDAIRDTMAKQVDATHNEAVLRDELMERELVQLAGRVQKKLDKDEMLWTQEVLERQVAGVAKNALGEQDLLDIQRALRAKMDRSQFHALLQQQHAKLVESGVLNGGAGGRGNQPLATATHCISCNNELPPSPSTLRATVQEEVRHEVAKALAAAKHAHLPGAAIAGSAFSSPSSPSPSSSSSFNASNHRSMDKHKKELLLAALQQQKK